jgi:glycerophosphoryl diester phosphodiesterase
MVSARQRSLAIATAMAVAVILTAATIGPIQSGATTSATNPFRTGRTLVIPHGGGDGIYPENTMYAYERTMASGADVVDIDLRLTSDGVLVAIHDPTVTRTTGAQGVVAEMTYAQLRTLDAGWAFAKGTKHPFRGKGITIPTVESIVARFPSALLSFDLKDESIAMNAPVCALLKKYGRRSDVFVGSNNDRQILEFRRTCAGVRTSATMVDVYASRDARSKPDAVWVPEATVDQPPYRIDGRTLVDAASLSWAHSHGVAILTWVVNDPKDMKRLVKIGVDGIYTSYPDRLLKVLGRSRSTTP